MKPFIHLFETPTNHYFYDVNRNENVRIEQDLYEYLYNLLYDIDSFIANDTLEEKLKDLLEKGYLSDNRIKEIKHPATDKLDQYLKRKLGLLTIQITQACNLRCSYCPYTSNDGSYRLHQNKKIKIETIKKSLIMLRDNSVDRDKVTVGFYGGEPLIEFGLIKETIDYCKEIFEGKEVSYTVTTNGTLISDEILELFEKEDFNIVISLDGPKELNDKNRKFANSDKSVFDEVIKNITYMSDNYKKNFNKMSINMVIDPTQDFIKYIALFREYPILNNINIRATLVEDGYKTEKYLATQKFRNDFNYAKFLSYLHYFGEIDMNDNNFYINIFFQPIKMVWEKLTGQATLGNTNCPSGPCIPGNHRLMVSVDGLLFPCERISENIDSNCIGSVDSGFNMENARNIMNIAESIIENCKNCFAFRHCTLCAKAHECKVVDKDRMKDKCKNVRYNFHNELIGREIINEIIVS